MPAGGRSMAATRRDENPAARQEYVIGRYHLWRDSDSHLERAIAHFERAIAMDPGYAIAHAGLGHAWWKRGLWGGRLAETESAARAAAATALRIDESLPDAYVVLADLERLYGGDLVRAERLVQRALALDPVSVDAHYTYGLLLMTVGRFGEAIEHMQIAAERDPIAPAIHSDLGRVLYRARQYDDAVVHLNRALDLEPSMAWLVQSRLADVYEQTGEYGRAENALWLAGIHDDRVRLARLSARRGNTGEARLLLEQGRADARSVPGLAAAYVALRDYDRAFALLSDWLDRDAPGPSFIAVDPAFDDLRADPRWATLRSRLNADAGASAAPLTTGAGRLEISGIAPQPWATPK
jgi:Tfp pilus assembly protein PilF